MLVGQPAAAEQRDLVFHSGARELLDESDPASPGQEYIDRIGIGGAYGGKLGRIIHLRDGNVCLARDLPFVVGLRSYDVFLSGDVVLRHEIGALDVGISHQLADSFARHVVLPGNCEEIWIAVFSGQLRRTRDPADDNGSGRGHGFYIGEKLIGQLLSNQKIDAVFLRQPRRRPQRRVRRHAGIFLEHLYRNPADLVSQHLERKIRSHVLLFAQNGERAGCRADDTEANAFGGSGCSRAGRCGRQGKDT